MSNYDGGWLFKCCPSETPCPCSWEDAASPFCADHCDRTSLCAGAAHSTAKPKARVVLLPNKNPASWMDEHYDAWYDWADYVIESDEAPESWQLNCACARLRVVIDDLRRLREETNR